MNLEFIKEKSNEISKIKSLLKYYHKYFILFELVSNKLPFFCIGDFIEEIEKYILSIKCYENKEVVFEALLIANKHNKILSLEEKEKVDRLIDMYIVGKLIS